MLSFPARCNGSAVELIVALPGDDIEGSALHARSGAAVRRSDKLDALAVSGLKAPEDQVVNPRALDVFENQTARLNARLDAALPMHLFLLLSRGFGSRRTAADRKEHHEIKEKLHVGIQPRSGSKCPAIIPPWGEYSESEGQVQPGLIAGTLEVLSRIFVQYGINFNRH